MSYFRCRWKVLIVLLLLAGIVSIIVPPLHLNFNKRDSHDLPAQLTSQRKPSPKEDSGVDLIRDSKVPSHDIQTVRPAPDNGEKPHSLFRSIFDISWDPPFEMGPDNRTHKDSYFIYRCDERTLSGCGGWLDRIQGAMAAYLIANLTGRTFKMEVLIESCDLHRFVVPNKVDWYIPVSFHEVVKETANVSVLRKMDSQDFMKNVDFDFSSMPGMESKFVYYKGNREYFHRFQSLRKYSAELAWMKNLTYSEIGNALYRRLLKPSDYLQRKTDSFLAEYLLPRERLVCAHMRTGQNPSIPHDSKYMRISETGISNVISFLQDMTKSDGSKIFFMSDNEGLNQRMRNLSFGNKFFFSPGKIVHIGASGGVPAEEKCEGLEKIIFEHYVLFHCDVILISRSAIGPYAAYLRNTDEGVYCLNNKGVVDSCKRNDITDVLGLVVL